MLAEREILAFVIEHGLVEPERLVDGDLAISDTSRRNRNFRVVSEHGPSYFLKQGTDPSGLETVRYESKVHRVLGAVAGSDELVPHLPRYYGYDAERGILILELLPQAENLRELHTRQERFPRSIGAAVGSVLGALHRLAPPAAENGDSRLMALEPPWALSSHRPPLGIFREVSSASIHIVRIIQKFGDFCELLDGLRADWRQDALVHFDFKWDNCIVSRSTSGEDRLFKLVDWELAGLGDPSWDVGSALADYLTFWLQSIPVTGETPPENFPGLARYPMDDMQPAIRALWRSYVERMALESDDASEALTRAVRYAAARLVQAAYEQMQFSIQLTGTAVCFLQVGFNILLRPEEAIVRLLGIPLPERRP